MLKAKNLFINLNCNNTNASNNYQFNLRLRRHIYYLNQYKIIDVKDKKSFTSLNFKQINFDLLTVFYTVVILGGVSKAAKRLSLTQPAVSLALRKLEKEMGSLVFRQVNSKTSILLTPAGLILFNYTQRFFQIIEESQVLLNLNQSQPHLMRSYPSNLLGLNTLPILKKKKVVFSFFKTPFSKLLAKKDFLEVTKLNLLYYETKSRFIILDKKLNLSNKLFKFNYKNSLITSIIVDKLFSLKALNKNIYSTLKGNNFIEIHTTNAYAISLDMKISNNLYWGSEI